MIIPDPAAMKAVRLAAGLTLADVSAVLMLSKTSMSKYENGKQSPAPAVLQEWADFFGLRVFLVDQEDTYTHIGEVAYCEGFDPSAMKALRNYRALTQAAVARKLGADNGNMVDKWESGMFGAILSSWVAWANALGAEFLIVGAETPLAREYDRE